MFSVSRGEHFLFVTKYTKRTSMVFRTTLLGAAAALAFAAPALGQTCTVDADCVGLDNAVDCTVGKCVASVCTSEDLSECLPTTPGCNNKVRQQLISVFEQELGAGTVTCDDDYTEMFDADFDEYCNDMSRGLLSNCNGKSPGCVGTWGASTVPEATGLIRDYIVSWMNDNGPPSDQWVINIALATDCASTTGTAGPSRIQINAWTGTDRVQYLSCATDSDCADASDVIGPSGWCLAYECDAEKGGYCVIRWQGCRYCEEGNIPCPGPSAAAIAACNGSIVTGCGTGLYPDACHHECVPNTKSFIARVPVGKQWRQGDAPITQFVPLSTSQAITGVGIVSDWWQKRPTTVRVYDGTADSQGTLIAEQSFTEYTNNVCGANFDETCAVGMSSLLLVPVDLQADGVWVEVEGLLSAANSYAKITEVVVLE